MYYYKDKRQAFNKNMIKFYLNKDNFNRQTKFIIALILFFTIFIFFNFSNQIQLIDDNILIKTNFDTKKESFIIDAILSPSGENEKNEKIFSIVSAFKNGIFIYNMSEPIETWWPFDCIKTRMKQSINTRLCIHDPKFDKYISAQIKENGLWEPTNVRSFLGLLKEVPDANVIDIGANIGLYSLLAAKLNRTVISVEPLHDNLNRIHKAAHLEGVQNRIIGLVNALSNKREQVKLSILEYNIGGSFIMDKELIDSDDKFKLTRSSVIVNSILMDDLMDVVKLRIVEKSPKFVIKIDIESYEPYVFDNSTNLFQNLQVIAIFLEFGKSVEKLNELKENSSANISQDYFKHINSMLEKFKKLNYEPYEMNGFNKLDYNNWRTWPWDVFLRQCDLLNCPEHTYKVKGV